ncbi:MAG: GGDEF domain-containing protein [Fibrobacter sp.]|nr:GGDEF domain-containing protein [Fibrobacter sp.]
MQNQLISTDSLTMLNNRNRLHHYLHQVRDLKNSFILMVDIDHFKQINDTYGHIEGDRALVLVSQALKKACERVSFSIFLCRYGGDEFLLIARTDFPEKLVERIHDCLQEVIADKGGSLSYTIEASMGYARWNGDINSFKECVVKADKRAPLKITPKLPFTNKLTFTIFSLVTKRGFLYGPAQLFRPERQT